MFGMPMNEKEMEKEMLKKEMMGEIIEMMTQEMIDSPMLDEHQKLSLKCLLALKSLDKTLMNCLTKKYTTPKKEADVETLKKVLEYVKLVEIGVKQFSETTPFVAHREEN